MKPLVILLAVFGIAIFILRVVLHHYDIAMAARIAMAAMLLFTALGHFMFTRGMVMMLPGFIPFRTGMVYLTGIIEIGAAIGLLAPGLRVLTGWFLIAFFVLLLPANIYAAMNKVNIGKGSFDGDGVNYLWFRVPLQILFIAWVYFCAIRS
jgi:uncharacterized membrane protein